jgi:flagellar hook-associated protein 2
MVNIVTGAITTGTGGFDSLDDIGVTLDKNGRLEISPLSIGTLPSGTEKLASVLETDLDNVGELFASSDGVTTQLQALIESYNGSDGTLTERKSLLSAEIKGIADEYESLESRLRSYEDTLRTKFSFLDSTVSYYNATSTWLTSALKLPTASKD